MQPSKCCRQYQNTSGSRHWGSRLLGCPRQDRRPPADFKMKGVTRASYNQCIGAVLLSSFVRTCPGLSVAPTFPLILIYCCNRMRAASGPLAAARRPTLAPHIVPAQHLLPSSRLPSRNAARCMAQSGRWVQVNRAAAHGSWADMARPAGQQEVQQDSPCCQFRWSCVSQAAPIEQQPTRRGHVVARTTCPGVLRVDGRRGHHPGRRKCASVASK